jgi:hypothetical protein
MIQLYHSWINLQRNRYACKPEFVVALLMSQIIESHQKKENVVCIHIEHLLNNKQEKNYVICRETSVTENHHLNKNKPEVVRQILHVFSSMSNLKLKRGRGFMFAEEGRRDENGG